jgi:hypothetical protein
MRMPSVWSAVEYFKWNMRKFLSDQWTTMFDIVYEIPHHLLIPHPSITPISTITWPYTPTNNTSNNIQQFSHMLQLTNNITSNRVTYYITIKIVSYTHTYNTLNLNYHLSIKKKKFLQSVADYTQKDQLRHTEISEELNIFSLNSKIIKSKSQ